MVSARSRLEGNPLEIAKVSYAVRRMQQRQAFPLLTSDVLKRVQADATIPTPREQADNLILWLGNQLRGRTGGKIMLSASTALGVTGATADGDYAALLEHLKDQHLIQGYPKVGLTLEGWDRFYELERAAVESRTAFMAMPFRDPVLDRVYKDCFKPAVKATGFNLRRLDEEPKAGLIDNRLRVEIRRSRFLIAELTGANPGAYWEAGFAEGLGRPVIYTCERSHFQKHRTHFDTNHCLTIRWSEDDLTAAAKELKATIRATLPGQAVPPAEEEDA